MGKEVVEMETEAMESYDEAQRMSSWGYSPVPLLHTVLAVEPEGGVWMASDPRLRGCRL
ncbi:hypothetical protein ACOMHN_060697 [Nucella lapillus]